ncbi:hypothetical protein [Pelagibacterium limicola]|uniref:hypothetical protein n=1 Tax=Pelagibacterium limicola TaxID=2791022 RepID=UPI0018AFBD92|nr:hypothetical protein [Pelagibacterium limicola]
MRPLALKMGIKPQANAFFAGAPPGVLDRMNLPPLAIAERLDGPMDYVHLFVTTRAALEAALPDLRKHLASGGKLWVSWPKGGRLGTDLNLREVIRIGYDHTLVESTCLSIDDIWSALKFTHPVPGRVYNNSYGTLPDR